ERGCDEHTPPPVVAGGAHRIVQESLTNAIKHGGPAVAVEVRLTCHGDELEIRITNSIDRAASADPARTAGAGLAGMAERADVLGGTFDAGPMDGRFVVTARLPTVTGALGKSAP
ncbi:MAG: ATP-binding protein, partial [Acidimicrobiales bacterium]